MYIGITSAPRKEPTLAHTIQSVRDCGYEPVVFAEPRTKVPEGVKTIWNPSRLGIWKNWKQLAERGLASGEEIIVTLQDDIDLHPDTLSFVERTSSSITGLLSLYTSKFYGRGKPPGVHHIKARHLWGACALAFTRESLTTILSHQRALSWERDTGQDIVISNILYDLSLPMHFVVPSPVSHISPYSTVGHGDNSNYRNCHKQANKSISLESQVWPNLQSQP